MVVAAEEQDLVRHIMEIRAVQEVPVVVHQDQEEVRKME